MKKNKALNLFSISGFRGSGKTSILKEVELLFREQYPHVPVAFLPHVLGSRPHPLDWTPEERKILTTSRLFHGWAHLNEACAKVKGPLAEGKLVFVDEFGLDVYLDAIACKDCKQQKDEAFQLHHDHLVPARIIMQGIRPPIYFIPRRRQDGAFGEAKEFHSAIERELVRYFDGTGQNPPVFLEGDTFAECAREIIGYVLNGSRQEVLA